MKLKFGITHSAVNSELQAMLEQFAKELRAIYPKKLRVSAKGIND